ncbi:MAG: DUF1015 domain-containing protein [Treponema sp.]|nr:DUF1015 domain-containing protein [Treponema sp.]
MNDIDSRLEKLGVAAPEILLPRDTALRQWAVIACDQFTQDRSYWEKAKGAAADGPSTLNMIFPEAFLADPGRAERMGGIHRVMRNYLEGGVFSAPRRGFIYLERDTPFNRRRRGLVAAIDLERYDWAPSSRPLIRSTEGTVPERLPPRMDLRRNAPLETQHVLLLIDDDSDALLPGLGGRAKKNAPVYQGELMLNSGGVSGWFLDAHDDWAFLAEGLEGLARRALALYPAGNAIREEQPFLFAAGDGNHSLASAKGVWEEYKKSHAAEASGGGGLPVHPCRYALVEIENIYDPAIQFEPIHRVVFGLGFDEAVRLLSALPGFSCREAAGREDLARLTAAPIKGNRFGVVSGNRFSLVETAEGGLATACLQPLLDRAAAGAEGALSIDYIHGEDELFRLSSLPGRPATGILLPSVQKAGFFETVARTGPLPRKSFSMGEASEKRFYVECRKLF